MDYAPIILFVYNRPRHTRQTLEALEQNKLACKSILYIFADGAKENAADETLALIKETRAVIKSRQWSKEVIICEREKNNGLADSIIAGVTEVVNRHGKVIVLEDDLVTSSCFLQFMNDALNMYESEGKVIQIGACNFFATGKNIPETFFVHIPDCWGWATWKDRWSLFERDAELLLKKIRSNAHYLYRFNCFGVYNFDSMLRDQIEGKVNSWAIRWQAVCVLHDKLILYPNPALTNHIASNNATHQNVDIMPLLADKPVKVEKKEAKESKRINQLLKLGYQPKDFVKMSIHRRVKLKIAAVINKFT